MRRLVLSVLILGFSVAMAWAAGKDTPAAAATRKRLKDKDIKIALEIKMDFFKTALEEITSQVDDAGKGKIAWKYDTGVSMNSRITVKCKDKTVEEALDEICKQLDIGYVVESKAKDRYDGWVVFKKNAKLRGYDEGEEPKDKEKPKDK